MTEEEIQKIQAIYSEAIEKLRLLKGKKTEIINNYIKNLEEQKIKALRESLGLKDN